MRRGIALLILLICGWAGQSSAVPYGLGSTTLLLKGGYYLTSEKEIDDGVMFGLGLGRTFDRNIALGLEFNYFGRTFDKKVAVEDSTSGTGDPIKGYFALYEHHSRLFPMMATLRITPALAPGMPFKPYFGAGVGYALMYVTYDFKDSGDGEDKDSELWGGFTWELIAGAQNRLGPRSTLLFELSYHECKVKETQETIIKGKPGEVELEIDMSGLGIWAGILLELF